MTGRSERKTRSSRKHASATRKRVKSVPNARASSDVGVQALCSSPSVTVESPPSLPSPLKVKVTTFKANRELHSKKWRLPPIRKPPQLLRWDLLGVFASRMWGAIHSKPLPVWARKIIYRAWAFTFRADLNELRHPLETYPTLRDFFTRPLREGVREIALRGMSSPCDGRVVVFGEVTNDYVEQVKGVTYPLSGFLGSRAQDLMKNKDAKLYHCVLYLAPGDYHRFHSPLEWTVCKSRHFPGTLFPISPLLSRLIPNLFALNERVVLLGEWDSHQFCSLTAVGAYNVGSISLNFDEHIRTNQLTRDFSCPNLQYFSFGGVGTHGYEHFYEDPVHVKKGEEIGCFNLGSTIVLVFESQNDFEFSVKPGEYVKMGMQLGAEKIQPKSRK